MTTREHWEHVYETKSSAEVSWYTPHLEASLSFVDEVSTRAARVIDVGGGASTLVDDLLARGYSKVTVLDVSARALDVARARLGERERLVTWLAADITTVDLGESAFDVWHDRAVFHFLTTPEARAAYVATMLRALAPGGYALIATFSPSGPMKCSGLDVVRYDAEKLHAEFGERLELLGAVERTHVTPSAREQRFLECRFRKR